MNWSAALLLATSVHVALGAGAVMIDWNPEQPVKTKDDALIEPVAILRFADTEDAGDEEADELPDNTPPQPEPEPVAPPPPKVETPPPPPEPRPEPIRHEPEPAPEPVPTVTVNPLPTPTVPAPEPVPHRSTQPVRPQPAPAQQPVAATHRATTPVKPTSTKGTAKPKPLSKKGKRAQKKYLGELMAWLAEHKDYPAALKKDRIEGVVKVRFTISKSGKVLSAEIAKSSGYPLLDAAGLAVLEKADPVPPIPKLMGREQLTLTLPIEFSLITD